jgi:hypothetical protein
VIVQFADRIGPFPTNPAITGARFFHDRKVNAGVLIKQDEMPSCNYIIVFKFAEQSAKARPQIRDGDIKENYTDTHNVNFYRIGIEELPIFNIKLINKIQEYKNVVFEPGGDEIICLMSEKIIPQWFMENNEGIIFEFLGVIGLDDNYAVTDEKPWLTLPRFIVGPEFGYVETGAVFKGSVGQVYGRPIRKLKTFSCSFARVKKDIIDEYYGTVSKTRPHWAVPYPEAIKEVPPIWATLDGEPKFTKRAENNWYWDCKLSWTEAY